MDQQDISSAVDNPQIKTDYDFAYLEDMMMGTKSDRPKSEAIVWNQ